jgi:hypothetical protein
MHGRLEGGTFDDVSVDGVAGRAAALTDSARVVADLERPLDTFTVAFWAYKESEAWEPVLKSDGLEIGLKSNMLFHYRIPGKSGGQLPGYPPRAWFHVAFTRDSEGWLKIFVNAKLTRRRRPNSPEPVRFGRLRLGGFGGKIDEFAIYDRALPFSDIAVLSRRP